MNSKVCEAKFVCSILPLQPAASISLGHQFRRLGFNLLDDVRPLVIAVMGLLAARYAHAIAATSEPDIGHQRLTGPFTTQPMM
jgi:hypothetical protein